MSTLRAWLLAPGRIESWIAEKYDTSGKRLVALRERLPAATVAELEANRPAPPDPEEHRAFVGDLFAELEAPSSEAAAAAARPYLGRALRCHEEVSQAETEEEAAWLVDDLLQALGWAAEAQDGATGTISVADYQATQRADSLFGYFLGKPEPAKHPELVGKLNRARAFRWHRWARRVAARDYLSRAAKQVAYILADFADARTGECWPSQSQLAELSGLTTRAIRDATAELESCLALVVEHESKGGRDRKRYRLLAEEVEPYAIMQAIDGAPDDPEGAPTEHEAPRLRR
jgi:Helix-turn-helix domain